MTEGDSYPRPANLVKGFVTCGEQQLIGKFYLWIWIVKRVEHEGLPYMKVAHPPSKLFSPQPSTHTVHSHVPSNSYLQYGLSTLVTRPRLRVC
jgi:hypothetical protein